MYISALFQNSACMVCIKPAGVNAQSIGMPERLEQQYGGAFFCVHRLDQAVGGVMVYARSREAAAMLSKQIAGQKLEKEYLAVVEGCPQERTGLLRDLLYHDAVRNKSYVVKRKRKGVREASLSYELLEATETEAGMLSLVRVCLHTGRSHQIRVQFASRGLPLVGDRRYGSRTDAAISLWSAALGFDEPESGRQLCLEAPPPEPWPGSCFSRLKEQGGMRI